MSFEDVLNEIGARLTLGNSWLVLDNDIYVVYRREFGEKKTKLLIETEDREKALKTLIESEK